MKIVQENHSRFGNSRSTNQKKPKSSTSKVATSKTPTASAANKENRTFLKRPNTNNTYYDNAYTIASTTPTGGYRPGSRP